MKYEPTPAEQETIILWDNELDTAEVYTHDSRMIRRLKELSEKHPEQFVIKRSDGMSVTYAVPKRYVSIRAPYSEARRSQQKRDAAKFGLPFMRKDGDNSAED